MNKLKKIFLFIFSLFLVISLSFFLINLFPPRNISAKTSEPELILFLAGSSMTPFNDLSPYNHPVTKITSPSGDSVEIVYDSELGRPVFSFAKGGYLEIPDTRRVLKLTQDEEMTIEINVKITDQDPRYFCGEPILPITEPIPDQMIFCKGPIDYINGYYIRNYALGFGWGRDNMRDECGYGNVGYFPGVGFGIGGMTHGFDSPMNSSELVGWRVYSFLISRISESETMVWCYINQNDNPYPANFPIDEITSQANDYPLVIGNGFATSGTAEFQPNAFYGYIDYIRIYKGLLPEDQLNDDPSVLPELPVAPNQPPVAVCQDVTVEATQNCQAQASIDGGSYDPEGNPFTITQIPQGPYDVGDTLVTLTVTDNQGRTSTCDATVTVTDKDTDGDGVGDTCDPDIDGDGIQNDVDKDPAIFSDEFSDINLEGTTEGIITDRADQILTIADSKSHNKGINIKASADGGLNSATVSLCGGATELALSPGDKVTVTCGSVMIEVISGSVDITYFAPDGAQATTSLVEGNSLLFEPATFIFTAPSTNQSPVVVIIDGEELSLEPGQSQAWVQIDIKPGSFPNSINPKSKGKIPVAILSNLSFNAPTQIEKTSLTFGKTGDEESLAFCSKTPEDVNGDGLLDLICHFYTQLTGFKEGDIKAVLKGVTVNGVPIEGVDSVKIVGKNK